MTITWLGHSCFVLESGGFRAVLDPFRGVQGLPDVETEAGAVYCSHGHMDHAYTEKIRLSGGMANPFDVREIAVFHDDQGGALRGANTIRKFTAEGLSVVHLGDLGHLLTPQQVSDVGHCDVLLTPVGGYFTIDAAAAKNVAEALDADVIVPMHYRKGSAGFDVLGTLEDFTKLFPGEMIRQYGSSLTVEKNMPKQIAVLKLG